ncbi:MAG: transcriptional regulator [Clostridiales bacterium GWF2_38_85]|nr:MAG: transcriptional regulator [Clostridiales bacterium GWF2_38_85]
MYRESIRLPEIQLVGVAIRTNNKAESDPFMSKIGIIVQRYFRESLSEKIVNRKSPGKTFCVYADYEGDHRGDYTYLIGEEVTSCGGLPDGFITFTIPTQSYIKFTNGPGPMPKVCIQVWEEVWSLSSASLGGERNYRADFEIYDERAEDSSHTELDVYVGVSG